MNTERFIADRISSSQGQSFTGLIVKIAIAAVALSMMVMIITTNVITGFKNQISAKVFDFWGHIHISEGNPGDTFEAVPFMIDDNLMDTIRSLDQIVFQPRSRIDEKNKSLPALRSEAGIKEVHPYIVTSGILSDKEFFEAILLKGVEAGAYEQKIQSFLKEGEMINLAAQEPTREILLSTITAERMGFEVGDRLIVNFIVEGEPLKRAFSVKGIYKTGLGEYDKRFAMVDMRVLQDVLGWTRDEISGLQIHVDELEDMDVMSDYLLFDILPGRLYSESVRDKFYQIFHWLELQNINERVLILLMILVAVFNMITALLIFVLERTKMIGILKALGAQDWLIRKIFLYNAARIIIVGVLVGNALAIGFCMFQKYTGVLKLSEQDYYLDRVPIEFNLLSMVLINVGAIVCILLFLIIPSRIVSRISPVKAVQFK